MPCATRDGDLSSFWKNRLPLFCVTQFDISRPILAETHSLDKQQANTSHTVASKLCRRASLPMCTLPTSNHAVASLQWLINLACASFQVVFIAYKQIHD